MSARPRRSPLARRLTTGLALAGALVALAALALTTAAARAAGGGPWQNPSYTPRPGDWRPYVLAPSSHRVRPVAIERADPRGGQINGDPAAALSTTDGSVQLVSSGDRTQSPLLIIDFGKEVGGQVQVHVTGASATRPALHACFSESLQEAALLPGQNDGETAIAPGCDTANIWNGYPGQPYTYDADSHTLPLAGATLPATLTDPAIRGGFRYLTLFLDGPGSVSLNDVTLHFTPVPSQSDPADYRGWFQSSDNTLNKIWYAGAYTVQMDTGAADTAKSWPYTTGESDRADSQIPNAAPGSEVIYDGAKRDRDVWQGDLSVEDPVTALTTGDTTAITDSLSALAAQQLPDGFVPAEGLVGRHNLDEERSYGEYVTWFISNMAQHYLYSGDRAYLNKWYPALVKATAWLQSVQDEDPQGLIAFGHSGSCGHYAYSDCGHETYVNALFYRNLQQMATLARAEGQPAAATAYAQRATALRRAINAQLWDPSAGSYELSREDPAILPQDADAAAILTGVAPPARASAALAYLRGHDWSAYGSLTVGASNPVIPREYEPLPMSMEAQARLADPDPTELVDDSGLQLIRDYWGWNLTQDPQSTFWEKATADGTPAIGSFTSLAHGWAAGPTVTLTEQLLGVQPTRPGYRTWSIVPHPAGVAWAQGAVPTPRGDLKASWTHSDGRFTLHADVPASTSGTLAAPTFGASLAVSLDGRVVWRDGHPLVPGVHADRNFVYVDHVGPGRHVLSARAQSAPPAAARLDVVPSATSAIPGQVLSATVTLTASSPGTLRGRVTAHGPAGWALEPAIEPIDLASDGRPVSRTRTFYLEVPDAVASGSYPVTFTFAGSHGVSARRTFDLTVTNTTILYGFEDAGADGWTAGANVSSVGAVTRFANGPGTPFDGGHALGAVCDPVAADEWHTISVTPSQPLDLSAARTFTVQEDSYGGAPGATGYQTRVTLTGSDGQTLTTTAATRNDTWNEVDLDVGNWPERSAVSSIAVSFAAPGSTYSWGCQFQIDDVRWSG